MWWQIKEETKPEVIIIEAQPVEDEQFSHIIAVAPLPIVVPRQLPQRHQPPVVHICTQPAAGPRLSDLLLIGRQYHAQCRGTFVERVEHGYYAYERWVEWRTCALAAVYAAAFGPASIERPEFSYTQAVWQLSRLMGWGLEERMVQGPTGRRNNVATELVKLVDENYWDTNALA